MQGRHQHQRESIVCAFWVLYKSDPDTVKCMHIRVKLLCMWHAVLFKSFQLTRCSLQAIVEDLKQTKKIPSEKLKRQPVLVGASAVAAVAGLGAILAASAQAFS